MTPIPYSVKTRKYVYKNTYTRMLIASLFIIEKNLKQRKCWPIKEWKKYDTIIED